jgi:hypothetical protein
LLGCVDDLRIWVILGLKVMIFRGSWPNR